MVGGIVLIFGVAWDLPRAFGEERIPRWFGMTGNYYRDAFWIGLGGSALLLGLHRIIDAAVALIPTLHRICSRCRRCIRLRASRGRRDWARFCGIFSPEWALASAFLGGELRVRWLRLLLFLTTIAALIGNWGSATRFAGTVRDHGNRPGCGSVRHPERGAIQYTGMVSGHCLHQAARELQFSCWHSPTGFTRRKGTVLAALGLLLLWPLLTWRLQPQAEGPRAS